MNNSSALASHEVEDVVMEVIEQFCDAGFEIEDIMEGIELAIAFSTQEM